MADTRRSTRISGLIAIACVLGAITCGCRTPWQSARFSASELADVKDAESHELEGRQGSPLTARLRPGPRSKPRPGDAMQGDPTQSGAVQNGAVQGDQAQEIGLIAQIKQIKSEQRNLRSAERNSTADTFIEVPEEIQLDTLPSRARSATEANPTNIAQNLMDSARTAQGQLAQGHLEETDLAEPGQSAQRIAALAADKASKSSSPSIAYSDGKERDSRDTAVDREVAQASNTNNYTTQATDEDRPLRIRISDRSDAEVVSKASHTSTAPSASKTASASASSDSSESYVGTAVAEQAAPINIQSVEPTMPAQHTETQTKAEHAALGEAESPQDLRTLAIAILEMLEAEAEQATNDERREELSTQSRLLRVILDDLSPTEDHLQNLDPAAQKYIRDTLLALEQATNSGGDSIASTRMTEALERHRSASQELASIAPLRVLNLAFCTEIDNFGVIKKFPRYRFRPNQQVLLYCELENFVSKSFDEGYETRLGGYYRIIDAQGRSVVKRDLPEDRDLCANRRSDFYIGYLLSLPDSIAAGPYKLQLSIEDIHGKKSGQAEVEFRIDR
ncbi:MAG: hypothetical protein NXI32_18345 [bacterium]|nr:hypothetical protein [bacterium]